MERVLGSVDVRHWRGACQTYCPARSATAPARGSAADAHRAGPGRGTFSRSLILAALALSVAWADLARAASWPAFAPAAQKAPAQPQQPHPAVVRVIAPEGEGTSYGSGTLVDVRGDYGLVLTNWHVVADATGTVEVVFPDGFRSAARVITTDRVWDLAALAIWKPHVAPVKLSARAPQPGDPLTIAGYGSGSYRAVTGTCTQYVAPGMNKPYEMVELSVAARQGDSGGPILNSQGELAGVLWGAGWGTTSGSYSGRVAAFVSAIMPPPGVGEESQIAQASSAPSTAATQSVVPVDYNAPIAQNPRGRGAVTDHQTTAARMAGTTTASRSPAGGAALATQGPGPVEEIELFLAFVGAVALVMHAVRLVLPGK